MLREAKLRLGFFFERFFQDKNDYSLEGALKDGILSISQVEQLRQEYQQMHVRYDGYIQCGYNITVAQKIKGLVAVPGRFLIDRRDWLGEIFQDHEYCFIAERNAIGFVDPNKVILDTAATQFNRFLRRKTLIPTDIVVVRPGTPLYRRYR